MKRGTQIILGHKRPDEALVKRFRGLPIANMDDCLGRMAAVDASIKPFSRGALCGTAFTVRVPAGDNLMVHKAMDLAQPGDVLVIDAGGYVNRAILGELMVTYCRIRGLAGIVVDGAIRDADALAELEGFPIYARAAIPNGPYKNGPGEIGTDVVIGGQLVRPGDIVTGDGDGILVVHPEEAEDLLRETEAVMQKEAAILETMKRDHTYVRPWVDEKLKELGIL